MVTVPRLMPWFRARPDVSEEVAPLVAGFSGLDRARRVDAVCRAYRMAADAHSAQKRKSGEPYIIHPVAVARIVAEMGLDEVSICAALLHDAVEDTGLEVEDIAEALGDEVAAIVDGVTKLDRLSFGSKEQQQAASFRKMLVAMSEDMRVLIIKLCDRTHNLRTLAAMPQWKQERTARETLDIYAPLANRLGVQEIKVQLEELSFAALHPKRYAEIDDMVARRAPERDVYLAQVIGEVERRLDEVGIDAEVTGREKHYYSIYEKMVIKGRSFADINDLIGIRVVVGEVSECYGALGSIHAEWKPVQGRFKDYVAMPKYNLYQSLHTTVIGPQGKPLEVQIRTQQMHTRAEFGVAAHYAYKEQRRRATPKELDTPWLNQMLQEDQRDPDEYLANLKEDLNYDETFVFSPQGDVFALPGGATAIDFAYAVHTDVGHRLIGAKSDGRLIALSEPLRTGATIEILTSKSSDAGPSLDWLTIAKSHRAVSKIKQWFSRERREDAINAGKSEVQAEIKRAGLLPLERVERDGALEKVVDALGYNDIDTLYAAVAEGHVSARSVAQRLTRDLSGQEVGEDDALPVTVGRSRRRHPGSAGVHVEGLDDMMVRLSKCCTPVPGDQIMGFVTRGRGVSIHRSDCSNAVSLASAQNDRLVEVEWDTDGTDERFVAAVEVKAYDRPRLLGDISQVLAEHHVNIVSSSSVTGNDQIARLQFEFEISDPVHLRDVLSAVRRIEGVYDAARSVGR